jgi:hypothetical protein
MNELSRLTDPDSGASVEERQVLRAADAALPPEGAEDRVWMALVATLGPAALGAASQSLSGHAATAVAGKSVSAGAAKAAGAWLTVKIAAVSLVGTAVVGGAAHLLYRAPAERPGVVRSAPSAPSAAAVGPQGEPVRATEQMPSQTEELRAPAAKRSAGMRAALAMPSSAAAPANELEREAGMLSEARAQLKRGDLSGASDALEALRTAFPSGALTQEREVVAIDVLVRSGRTDEADRRARAFLATYPDSPHAAKVRGAVLSVDRATRR